MQFQGIEMQKSTMIHGLYHNITTFDWDPKPPGPKPVLTTDPALTST